MDNSDPLTDLMELIATEQATLLKLCNIKETLQNEVVAKQEELERVQGVKRKQQEKHTQPKKKQKNRREYKYPLCRYVKQHLPWHKHGIHKYINQRQCFCG